jgi:hypothetical protein
VVAPLNFQAGQRVTFAKDMSLVPASANIPHPVLLLPVILGQWADGAGTFKAAAERSQIADRVRRAQASVAGAQQRLAAIETPGERQRNAFGDLREHEIALKRAQEAFAAVEATYAAKLQAEAAARAAEARELARQLLAALETVGRGMQAAGDAAEAAGVDAKPFADAELLGASVAHLARTLGLADGAP